MKKFGLKIFPALICGALLIGCISKVEEPQNEEEPPTENPTEPVLGQIKSMGFTQPIVDMPDVLYKHKFRPKLKLIEDTLFVCSYTGIYKKNLYDDTDFEIYAFENVPIREFVKNGNQLLASKEYDGDYIEFNTDSLLLLSNDNGQTFIDFTPSYFLYWEDAYLGYNYLFRIVQNPKNPNSLLVLSLYSGISKSDDFGVSWETLHEECFGYQNWDLAFHPLDTTTLFCTGESMIFFAGIRKSSDNGKTWSLHEKDNNCFHSIAFHPTNPDILALGGEYLFEKSTDKGETWNAPSDGGDMYFYKVLFDEENPEILYASGVNRDPDNDPTHDIIFVYRSTDMGDSWHLFYQEYVGEECGYVRDMVKYKNKLIFYTRDWELFELDLENTSN